MKNCFFIFAILIHFSGVAQQIPTVKQQHFQLSVAYGNGKVLPTSPFVKGDNLIHKPIDKYQYMSLKAMWQNPGYTSWQRIYRSPYYGVGLSLGDFNNPLEISYPVSYYGIFGLPLVKWEIFNLFTEFQFGLTSNWKKYDPVTNHKNIVIGGGLTVHTDLGLKFFLDIGKHLDIGGGVSFIHFSNGGFERPNRGFNIATPHVELKYRFADRPDYKNVARAEKQKRTHDLFVMLGYGDYQLVEHELDTNYFAFGGLSLIYFNQLTNRFRLGGGTDLNYWWGLNAYDDGTYAGYSFENITVGLILQPEMIIDRLTFTGGIGIYARHRNYGNFTQLYQRLGARFDVYKNLSLGVNVRSVNFMLAEVMEFNLAYKFKWEKE